MKQKNPTLGYCSNILQQAYVSFITFATLLLATKKKLLFSPRMILLVYDKGV